MILLKIQIDHKRGSRVGRAAGINPPSPTPHGGPSRGTSSNPLAVVVRAQLWALPTRTFRGAVVTGSPLRQ
jgi:hypothetical protein